SLTRRQRITANSDCHLNSDSAFNGRALDFGKGKKPPSLCCNHRAFGQRPKSEAVEVIAQWNS
ncbi:hypothetical protein, partial [Rhizobium leguminosarum]|uniref:hypothetical protein n=1 Tax=Rhizobium leguminosarum TaxID=384 RepID=UPI00197CBFE2